MERQIQQHEDDEDDERHQNRQPLPRPCLKFVLSGPLKRISGRQRHLVGDRAFGGIDVAAEKVTLPAGYTLQWTGQYEFQARARQRLTVLVPLVVFIIFVLLYL